MFTPGDVPALLSGFSGCEASAASTKARATAAACASEARARGFDGCSKFPKVAAVEHLLAVRCVSIRLIGGN